MPGADWSDRDFDELLRRAAEAVRSQEKSVSSVSGLRAALSESNASREAAQPEEVWGLVRLALWSVAVLGGMAGIGFILVHMLLKAR